MKLNPFAFLLLLALGGVSAFAQDEKAIRAYNQAREFQSKSEPEKALKKIDESLERDPNFADPALLGGELCLSLGRLDRAQQYFDLAWKAKPVGFVAYRIAESSFNAGLYERAAWFYEAYLRSADRRAPYEERSEKGLENARFSIQTLKKKSQHPVVNLGMAINTAAMEYFPSISADGELLVFTYRDTASSKKDEDFKQSIREGETWGRAQFLRGRLNTPDNEGAQCVSADGRFLVFTGCNRQEGKGSCDLYFSTLGPDGQWSLPRNLGDSINTPQWETQPSLAPDGSALFFVRGRLREPGQSDIYVAYRRPDGRFSRAVRLPAPINTPGTESTPFIHFDQRTLFFASNGHVGMGGLDFYVSRLDDQNRWSEPVNLGHPINGPGDQSGLVVGADGATAFFGSNSHSGGFGSFDLYTVLLPDSLRALPTSWIKGRVLSAATGAPLRASLRWTRLSDAKVFFDGSTSGDGRFTATVPSAGEYSLTAESDGHLFYSGYYRVAEGTSALEPIEILMEPIVSGKVLRLNNVFFSTNSSELRPESRTELNLLSDLLKVNADLRIRIEGHTDAEGETAANQTLSENRSKSVRDYLVGKGVAPSRLEVEGFGESRPIDSNETETGRQKNRRTEIRLLSK